MCGNCHCLGKNIPRDDACRRIVCSPSKNSFSKTVLPTPPISSVSSVSSCKKRLFSNCENENYPGKQAKNRKFATQEKNKNNSSSSKYEKVDILLPRIEPLPLLNSLISFTMSQKHNEHNKAQIVEREQAKSLHFQSIVNDNCAIYQQIRGPLVVMMVSLLFAQVISIKILCRAVMVMDDIKTMASDHFNSTTLLLVSLHMARKYFYWKKNSLMYLKKTDLLEDIPLPENKHLFFHCYMRFSNHLFESLALHNKQNLDNWNARRNDVTQMLSQNDLGEDQTIRNEMSHAAYLADALQPVFTQRKIPSIYNIVESVPGVSQTLCSLAPEEMVAFEDLFASVFYDFNIPQQFSCQDIANIVLFKLAKVKSDAALLMHFSRNEVDTITTHANSLKIEI